MKEISNFIKHSLIFSGMLFLFSCSDSKDGEDFLKKAAVVTTAKTTKGAFPFYKDINVKPGLNFEVVSWGRGLDSLGGYLILMSDSVKNKYNSLSVARNGIVTDAWNMDMDNDGNPEVYIELLSKKNVLDLNVYEYSGGDFRKITFPPLSSSQKKEYAGNDKFLIRNGKLFRSFPIVNSKDTTIKAGAVKVLYYQLRGNSFSVDEAMTEE